jgi:hypothetical protein
MFLKSDTVVFSYLQRLLFCFVNLLYTFSVLPHTVHETDVHKAELSAPPHLGHRMNICRVRVCDNIAINMAIVC